MNKSSKQFWDQIEVQDIIQLNDEQTIEYLFEQCNEEVRFGADFTITRIKDFSLNDGAVEMKMLELEFKDIVWYLIVRFLGDDVAFKLYYEPDDFACGNRDDMIRNECFYLFEEPDDEENVMPEDLNLSTTIEDNDSVYRSEEGVMYGSACEDGQEDFAMFVQLSTDDDVENPDLLIVELCYVSASEHFEEDTQINIDSGDSYIMFLQGCSINANDIEILK